MTIKQFGDYLLNTPIEKLLLELDKVIGPVVIALIIIIGSVLLGIVVAGWIMYKRGY